MVSPECQQIRTTLVNDRETLAVPLTVQRQEWQAAATQVALPPTITIRPFDAPGLAGEWLSSSESAAQPVLLYLLPHQSFRRWTS